MAEPADTPAHPPVEGPETPLEDVREESHLEAGAVREMTGRLAALEAREKELAQRLEAREKELLDRLARLQADFENFRRRSRDEATAAAARGKETLLKALLPVLDSLDRALAHSQDEGLRLLARQLHDALREQGVEVIDPQGGAFDAHRHEAVAQEAREGAKAGAVLQVLEKGYALEGRVLRPARVVVAA